MPGGAELRREPHAHITLAFIGEVDVGDPREFNKVEPLKVLLDIHVGNIGPVRLILGYLSTFPGVLWTGIGGTTEDLDEFALLQMRVGHAIDDVGFQTPKHPYIPHITIGRFDKELTDALTKRLADSEFPEQVSVDIPAVELLESVRVPGPGGGWQVEYLTVGDPHLLRMGEATP